MSDLFASVNSDSSGTEISGLSTMVFPGLVVGNTIGLGGCSCRIPCEAGVKEGVGATESGRGWRAELDRAGEPRSS